MMTDTIPARFLRQRELRPDHPAYVFHENGVWKTSPWRTFVAEVRLATRALVQLGFRPGSKAVILGCNRPEWTIFDLAAMCAGGVPVGIYTTNSVPEVRYIVEHSEAVVALVDSIAQWEKICHEREHLPKLRYVVFMRGVAAPDDPLALSWEAFAALAEGVDDRIVDERVGALTEEQPAMFIYTSGTTGPPKAVVLSHRNLAWTAGSATSWVGVTATDSIVSYLPLSHIAEQLLTIHGPATVGMTVWYAPAMEKLREALVDARPTILLGMPRVWEKMHEALSVRMTEVGGLSRTLLEWARATTTAANECRMRGEKPSLMLRIRYKFARLLVLGKILRTLGLDRCRIFVSGAAPISRTVLDFFASIDVIINEVYGQSEGTGTTSFNLPGRVRFGTVGQPFEGVDVRLAPDGEILVRGPNVFAGYFKEPGATTEAMRDGWLLSGDLGEFDADGFLRITCRKKEIIITAGGKNISPTNIEDELKRLPLIADAVVIGDRRKFLSALLTLRSAEAERLGPTGIDVALKEGIARVNAQFSRVESIRRYHVLPNVFSVDTGELTPTMKLRRKAVAAKYAREIETMYASGMGE